VKGLSALLARLSKIDSEDPVTLEVSRDGSRSSCMLLLVSLLLSCS
jgi:hypothetical protein